MPVLDFITQTVKDFPPFNRFTPLFSALYAGSQWLLRKGFNYVRRQIPTIENIAHAYEQSPDLAHIVKVTAKHNIVYYAAPMVATKMLFAPARGYFPFSSSVFMLCEEGAMASVAVWMLVSNILYNLALTKALQQCKLPEDKSDCDCGVENKMRANIANLILYCGILAAASALNLLAPALPENLVSFAILLQSLGYGYSLAGMQYSIHGACATHCSALLNNHKLYYLSLGATLIYSVNQSATLISRATGVARNYYVDDALFMLLWQQAMIAVVMQGKSPDYLHKVRERINNFLMKDFKSFLDNSKPENKRDFVRRFNQGLTSPLGKLFLSAEAARLTLDMHREDFKYGLNWVVWLNESTTGIITTSMLTSLPHMFTSSQVRALANIIKQQDWRITQIYIEKILGKIGTEREIKECGAHIEKIALTQLVDQDYVSHALSTVPIKRSGSNLGLFDQADGVDEKLSDDEYENVGEEDASKLVKNHQLSVVSRRG